MSRLTAFAAENARLRKKRSGSIGLGVRASQATNAPSSRPAATNAATITGLVQPVLVAVDQRPDESEEAGRREAEARQVERRIRAVALREEQVGERHERDADRHVDPEDPLPAQPFGDGAAHERAQGDGESGDGAPRAEGEAAPLGRDGGREDGQGERRDEGRAHALDRAGEDQQVSGRREGGRRGTCGEQDHADGEDALAAEAVAEGGAREQEHGEGQRVGVDHPLELGQRGAQALLDDGQRGGHDEVVERDHEQGDGRDRKGGQGEVARVSRGHGFLQVTAARRGPRGLQGRW